MKKQFLIYLIIASVLLLAALVWWRPTIPQKEPAHAVTTNSEPIEGKALSANFQTNVQSTNQEQLSQRGIGVTNGEMSETRRENFKSLLEGRNKPIDVYGLVLDQYTNPVSGVKISVGVHHLRVTETTLDKTIHLESESDAHGRFEFHGETGDGFGITVMPKDGYMLSPIAPRGFGPNAGSFENPVIIKMWKEGVKEPLIGGSHVFGIDPGKTYTLNLITGKKIEGEAEGDLLVSITRPPDVKPRDKFPWSFSIEAMQGGLVEADPNDEFMYVAPESGYQPKIEVQFDPNDPAWVGIVEKHLFIRSRNGQIYGRAKVEIDSIYNVHSAIQIDYAINPNGSRNLQP